ncbi:hypothetical protein QFZ63_006945 [Streptomyces sp. B3I7]|nr:hypothetical protein [Streptomyces sp. B3I7]
MTDIRYCEIRPGRLAERALHPETVAAATVCRRTSVRRPTSRNRTYGRRARCARTACSYVSFVALPGFPGSERWQERRAHGLIRVSYGDRPGVRLALPFPRRPALAARATPTPRSRRRTGAATSKADGNTSCRRLPGHASAWPARLLEGRGEPRIFWGSGGGALGEGKGWGGGGEEPRVPPEGAGSGAGRAIRLFGLARLQPGHLAADLRLGRALLLQPLGPLGLQRLDLLGAERLRDTAPRQTRD